MDISVRHLNSRMAVQVPLELPLGLVFVVGQVENLHQAAMEDSGVTFELVEKGYRLRCRLSPRATTNIALMEQARARAGGHLMFDPTTASYYLVARDVEIMPASNRPLAARSELNSILADIKKRAEATRLTVSELPYWVQKMAPPEVRTELGLGSETETESNAVTAQAISLEELTPLSPQIDQAVLTFLSKAMDSDEDVELTPDILTRLAPDSAATEPAAATPTAPPPEPSSPLPEASLSTHSRRPVYQAEALPPQSAPRRLSVTEQPPEFTQADSNRERLFLLVIVMLSLTLFVVMLLLLLSL